MAAKIGHRARLFKLGWISLCPIVIQILPLAVTVPVKLQLLPLAVAAPVKVKLPPPPSRGVAGNRSAAASRDTCPRVSPPLTAIVPEYRAAIKSGQRRTATQVWGLTIVERPTFWFYIPYPQKSIVSMSFILQDESNPADTKIVYHNPQLVPTATAGMLGIELPQSIEPLAIDKPYHWYLTLNVGCGPVFVDGWVQRTSLDSQLSNRIDRATPADRVTIYAENGLWYDAIATSARLRSVPSPNPQVLQDWQNMLDAIGLKSIDRPIGEPSVK